MTSSNSGISGVTWFWGILLSLSLHIAIILIAIFWGFGSPMYSGEPESIQGTLVSISELGQPGGVENATKEEIKTSEPETKEETPKVEQKKPEDKIEVSKPKEKEPEEKEQKEVELKKEEPPKEKPKEDKIVLQEKKKEKKEVAKKPEPTERPAAKPKPPKKVENTEEKFEDVKHKVISDIQKKKILKELEEKRVASVDSSGEGKGVEKGAGYSTGGSSGASLGVLAELFVRRIREEIRSNWAIPENIPIDGTLKTVIVFKLDEKGRVSDVKVDVPSENSQFDDFCVKAIYRASPLTPPPSELLQEAKSEGLEITFTNDSS